ncbi:MAG: MerR family transcriptional regulator [Oscillospiraceae bacterium]|nr:MerR family transcriptional regulator [Oscillospiraceae bacterium]
MEQHRAIPKGYMTVGEVAKKMGTTVRTLQYYDKEGLLSPSAESEGGRRLYTDKDVIQLHQILSLKSLGFSLADIKNRLITLDTPAAVANVLTEQATAIREKMETLSESLTAIEGLKAEVVQMQSVNFKKYADIIVNLQMKNDMYWVIKHFDDRFLDHVRTRFLELGHDMGIMDTMELLQDEAIRLHTEGVPPESEQGQDFARRFWDMITLFTDGDMSLLSSMLAMEESISTTGGWDEHWRNRHQQAQLFIEPAINAYFTNLGYDPFEEVQS